MIVYNHGMKVAIVHDWLTNYGGAETVVELLLKIYPDADIFTLVYDRKKMRGRFGNSRIHTSRLQKIPLSPRIYTKLLKFMPAAFEAFDLSRYDLVLCSSSCCAKGVIVPPHIPQIAYIHSPMRYAWDLFFDYRKRSGRLTKFFMDRWIPGLRLWDYVSSQRIDTLVANSHYIARRIKKFWNRDARVIYPPLDTSRFFPPDQDASASRGDYYVAFSRLVPYKRIDLAVQVAAETGRRLVVIGSGPEEKRLRKMAGERGNIKFLGRAPDSVLREQLQGCRAMIFCAEEDFGLAPLEAQACGAPVVAFGRGGACETVSEGKTGTFFSRQDAASLADALDRFEQMDRDGRFDRKAIADHAAEFSDEKFIREFTAAVAETTTALASKQPGNSKQEQI